MNLRIQPNSSAFFLPYQRLTFGMSNLEGSLSQVMLDLADVVALDHDVPGRPVDHDLLLSKTQELPQLIPQHL